MIAPDAMGELATEAIEAKVVGDEGRVMDLLQLVLVEGTKLDALACLVACIYVVVCCLRPGRPETLWPVEVNEVGEVRPIPGNTHPGHYLLATVMGLYITGNAHLIRDVWLAAEDNAMAAAVGAGISSAASMIKQRRSVMN